MGMKLGDKRLTKKVHGKSPRPASPPVVNYDGGADCGGSQGVLLNDRPSGTACSPPRHATNAKALGIFDDLVVRQVFTALLHNGTCANIHNGSLLFEKSRGSKPLIFGCGNAAALVEEEDQ